MSWSELDKALARETPSETAGKDPKKELRQAALRAFDTKQQAPLREFLEAIVSSGSYRHDRSPTDVAYYEGVRAMALRLLKLTEKTGDDQ